MDYRWPGESGRRERRAGKRNGKPFPSSPYLEEEHVRGRSKETPKKRQCFARKLLPRAAVHINPRLAYCFPDQEKIYVRSRYIHLCALSGTNEVWKGGRSRLYARAHFVLSRAAEQ